MRDPNRALRACSGFPARRGRIIGEAIKVVGARASTARQVRALVDGLTQQWVRSGKAFDMVAEWDAALRRIFAGAAGKAG